MYVAASGELFATENEMFVSRDWYNLVTSFAKQNRRRTPSPNSKRNSTASPAATTPNAPPRPQHHTRHRVPELRQSNTPNTKPAALTHHRVRYDVVDRPARSPCATAPADSTTSASAADTKRAHESSSPRRRPTSDLTHHGELLRHSPSTPTAVTSPSTSFSACPRSRATHTSTMTTDKTWCPRRFEPHALASNGF